MLALVYGGSGSGKSAYAERLAAEWGGDGGVHYIATMRPDGEDAKARIARHREARRDRNFTTIELYRGLDRLRLPDNSVALLECLGNLLANEMFAPEGTGAAAVETIWRGLENLRRAAKRVIVVSNDVGGDGIAYSEETAAYCHDLAELNRRLAAEADSAVEMVCGIPLCLKKSEGR